MINLLYQSEKKKLKNEFRLRVAVMVLGAFLVVELWGGAVLALVYQFVYSNTKYAAAALEKKRAQLPIGSADLQRELTMIAKDIKLLQRTNEIPPLTLLHALVTKKPAGIRLDSFAYGKVQNTPSLQISGVADSRDDLIYFQRLLKEEKRFAEVRYEQSFITKKTDIDFRLTITINDEAS